MKLFGSQNGSALLISLAIMMLLFSAVLLSVNSSITETELSFNQVHSDKAFYVSLAGVERAKAMLDFDDDWRTGFAQESFEDGLFTVILVDSTINPNLMDTLLVRSVGEFDYARSIIEALLVKYDYHPLYNHAIYAGNFTEYDSTLPPDSQLWVSTMDFGGDGASSDIVTGDVHFNGHLNFGDDSELHGAGTAGGDYTGNPPTGGSESTADYLEPPDLTIPNYENTSDFFINDTSSWDIDGQLPPTDPRHIFVKDFRTDLATTPGYTFDNTNYFFGDPYEGPNLDNISVSASGNDMTYFVDGNLWFESNTTICQLINSPPEGTHITVVVKGNIYFADFLYYDDNDNDGLAFIAMTDGESYTDLNGNSEYDAGEPILHDDGDGVYEGPNEGSGNIRFGDPNGGPLGDVYGYLYAENNFEDYVLDGMTGEPQHFSVTGMLSAGNQMAINRDYGTGHSKMDITYDARLKNGTLMLPGLPKRNATSSSEWTTVAWREL